MSIEKSPKLSKFSVSAFIYFAGFIVILITVINSDWQDTPSRDDRIMLAIFYSLIYLPYLIAAKSARQAKYRKSMI